jgi:tRNA dimethylallyltransferase
MSQAYVPLLLGPTASGKSAVAMELARRRSVPILCADSMKIYRGLDVGVAKPTTQAREGLTYHFIDWKEPWESASVAEWLRGAEALIFSAAKSVSVGPMPLVIEGGTALYLQSLYYGIFDGPGRDAELRKRLESEAETQGLDKLYARLQEQDPDAAKKILPNDIRRIVRALEVIELSGEPISKQQVQWNKPREDMHIRGVGIMPDRKTLYEKIDKRVDQMLANGWLEECRGLLKLEKPLSREASQALGYRTLFKVLAGEMELSAARDRICFDTHHFARRQLMWFRRFKQVKWIDSKPGDSTQSLADQAEALWQDEGNWGADVQQGRKAE